MTLIIIILIILAVIYFYYQKRKLTFDTDNSAMNFTADNPTEFNQTKQANQALGAFLRTNLNSNSLEELKSKLNDKTLDEILEENEDYETEIDTLTRTKNSLEADLLAQSNGFQNRLREKDREVKKLKEDLASEKQQHKGSLTRITKLTEQITNLEQEKKQIKQQHTEQLRAINLLFDAQAKDYKEIDFNGLYNLLAQVAQKDLPGSFPQEKKDD